MHILWMILIGLLVGAVAKLLMPGTDPGGWIITILIGIAGSVIATYIGTWMHWYPEGATAGFIASVLGAMLLLLIYRMFKGKNP
ncbi:MAG: GlsB/YeaQ/YmgE family stress response membrane protein [bacterium]